MTELERTAQAIVNLWEIGVLTVASPFNSAEVRRAFTEFDKALRDVRVERLNQKEINSEVGK